MRQYSILVLTAAIVSIVQYEINAYRLELQAFDATDPLLRFQKQFNSYSASSNSSEPHLETLADVLLSPLQDYEDIPGSNVTEQCHAIMQAIATQGSQFTLCMLSHARPFRMCENCIKHYFHFTQTYEDLLDDLKCSQVLLLADSMHVMATMYSVFMSTWSSANCDACYDSVQENSTAGVVTFNYTADTLLFQEMQTNITRCFNSSDTLDDHGVNKVCVDCKRQYTEMNNNFSRLKKQSGGHICMDLVDMMNYTRLMWSSKFKCRRPQPDASVVIAIAVIVSIITILLYTSSKLITRIRMPQIFKAKRMARAAGGYAAISQEEVETSLPRFATSPTRNGGRRRTDSHKDMDGNSYPAVRKQAT